MRHIVIGIGVAIPVCIAFWVAMIAIALSGTAHLAALLVLGGGIGVLSGIFFGTWAGFVSSTRTLEELDRASLRRPSSGATEDDRAVA
jgi:hypothetical protein